MAAHNEDLVSALECSLQACVSLLVTDNAEKDSEKAVVNKSVELTEEEKERPIFRIAPYIIYTCGVEACITKFLDTAKTLEADFLRKQLYSRLSHPQEVTEEEVEKMKAELAQKEELLARVNQKVSLWANALQDIETRQARLHLADSTPAQRAATLDM